jgi:beta-lactamase regulating signal transducer with metallopeptidase domain
MSAWEVMSEIARTILVMSVTGSIIALLLFALKPLVKNRLPKNVQYYLWVSVLAAFLVPFTIFVSIPAGTPMAPVQELIEANVKTTVEWREELAQERYNMPYEELDAPKQIEISFKEIGLMKGEFNNYLLLSLIVMGGVIFLAEIYRYIVFTIKLRRRQLPAYDHEAALLEQLCRGEKRPRLYRNPLAPTPMIVGIFRPVIYLPDREYTEVQLRNILLHELAHLRRHDVAVKWLAALAVHVHWFNPFACLVRREIDRACELACDEAVIMRFDTNGKQSYGDTLLAMAADAKTAKTIVSATMCEEKKALKERLGAIMRSKRITKRVLAFSCVLITAVLCTIVVLGSSAEGESAADFFLRKYRDEAAVVRPLDVIAQVETDNGALLFYYNARGYLGCAVIEKDLFRYTVAKTSAEMLIDGTVPAQILSGQYNDAEHWLAWGILRDNSIEKVTFYGQEASILETDNLRLCYMLGDNTIPEDDNFRFFDGAGNLAWEMNASSATGEMTVYIWRDQEEIGYALFEGGKTGRTENEIKNGETVFHDINELNHELAKHAVEGMHLHIVQMNVSDFSKEEMDRIAGQIKLQVGNFSTSIGAMGT